MNIRKMTRSTLAVLAVCLMSSTTAASEAQENAALRAAQAWLVVVDTGNYIESWTTSASYFRNAVGQDQWRQSLEGVRQPLGNVLSRELKAKTYVTELPGAPDGEYVVIQFNTSFENKRVAVETVTPMLEADGTWQVSGYFIK